MELSLQKIRRDKMAYKKKTDWICNKCGAINDVYWKRCYCCNEKKQGNEERL